MFIKYHRLEHKLKFEKRGLVISRKYPFLGASPDGYVNCETCGEFLIEIKCPYALRNFFPRIAAKNQHCFIDENNIWQLKTNSSYYAQIQAYHIHSKRDTCN
jgi:hypothetical protein